MQQQYTVTVYAQLPEGKYFPIFKFAQPQVISPTVIEWCREVLIPTKRGKLEDLGVLNDLIFIVNIAHKAIIPGITIYPKLKAVFTDMQDAMIPIDDLPF